MPRSQLQAPRLDPCVHPGHININHGGVFAEKIQAGWQCLNLSWGQSLTCIRKRQTWNVEFARHLRKRFVQRVSTLSGLGGPSSLKLLESEQPGCHHELLLPSHQNYPSASLQFLYLVFSVSNKVHLSWICCMACEKSRPVSPTAWFPMCYISI